MILKHCPRCSTGWTVPYLDEHEWRCGNCNQAMRSPTSLRLIELHKEIDGNLSLKPPVWGKDTKSHPHRVVAVPRSLVVD